MNLFDDISFFNKTIYVRISRKKNSIREKTTTYLYTE